MDKNKLVLPIAILLASIILGGFYYASETNKQKSIERQQEIKLQEERAEEVFSNNLKCQTLLKDLDQRWSNIAGTLNYEIQIFCHSDPPAGEEESLQYCYWDLHCLRDFSIAKVYPEFIEGLIRNDKRRHFVIQSRYLL